MLRVGRDVLARCKTRLVSSRTFTAAATKLDSNVSSENKYDGYTVIETSEVPEFHAHATLLRHNATGAEHLHVYRDDLNNVFSVGFRTPPRDSTGAPHILEHTVLCGSEKYPCRDPFFKMLNRSLSTFMNAFTASDWTMYPFSTQNPKDYNNLMSVYLDAVFHPNLNEIDFKQEGWRLENSDLSNKESDIIFKGVVFNEMKGALSTAESIYCTKHQLLLLPQTYGHVSGGEPLDIPKLTWEDLKSFHSFHYHPSNARFFTYGNFPLEKTLDQIQNDVLKNFQKINPGTQIGDEQTWTEPRYKEISCPPDPMAADPEKQSIVSVSYGLPFLEDPFDSFVLGILSSLLVTGPNSPFYQALIEKNIGSDYSPVVGMSVCTNTLLLNENLTILDANFVHGFLRYSVSADTNTRNPTFSVGLQGLHKNDINLVTEIIENTFKKIYETGFDNERITSILHRVELAQKHQTSSFGLHLVMGLFPAWNQDKNPLSMLNFNERVDRFRETLATNPKFLQEKVKEYFLDNTHKLTLVMDPEDSYNQDQETIENELLKEKLSTLTEEDREQIYKQGLELERMQDEDEDLSVLPKMSLEDIEKKTKETLYTCNISENVSTYIFPQPTNGVSYFRCIATTTSIPYMLKPYLPLFSNVVTRLGAAGKDHRELGQLMELTTGGLSVNPHISIDHSDIDTFEQGISLSSHCLERNIPMMFSLWQDILNEPHLHNEERLRTLINAYASDLSVSIAHSGHMYAMSAAAKYLTPSSQIAEFFSGLSQVEFMKNIAELDNIDSTIESLMKIATYMLNANEMRCALNATEEDVMLAETGLKGMLSSLHIVGFDDPDVVEYQSFVPNKRKTFIEMDFPVNYVSRCIRAVPYTHADHPKLQILAKLLSAKFLHREIREKGGAYGGGARMSGGIFGFYSYRDPNTARTLDAFSQSVQWATQGQFKDDDIEEAKLSVFSTVDHPVSPANVGMTLFQHHLTDEMRQIHRDNLFAVNRDDLIEVANRYLVEGAQVHAEAIIGPKNEILINDSEWTIPRKVQLPS